MLGAPGFTSPSQAGAQQTTHGAAGRKDPRSLPPVAYHERGLPCEREVKGGAESGGGRDVAGKFSPARLASIQGKDRAFLSFHRTSVSQHNLLNLGQLLCLPKLPPTLHRSWYPRKRVLIGDMFHREDNRASERGRHFPKVTQREGSDLGFCPPRGG